MTDPYPVNQELGLFSGIVTLPQRSREGPGLYARGPSNTNGNAAHSGDEIDS